jgi:hypothetical protein
VIHNKSSFKYDICGEDIDTPSLETAQVGRKMQWLIGEGREGMCHLEVKVRSEDSITFERRDGTALTCAYSRESINDDPAACVTPTLAALITLIAIEICYKQRLYCIIFYRTVGAFERLVVEYPS